VDRKALDEIDSLDSSGDGTLLAKILTTYLEESSRLGRAMEQAIHEQDAAALKEAAHSLKSSSAQVGAHKVSKLCRELEKIGLSGKTDEAKEPFSLLCKEYSQVRDFLKQELDGSQPVDDSIPQEDPPHLEQVGEEAIIRPARETN
jgi:HPt (histidine-containing phosphotransfer) domain-containing protein